MTDHKTGTLARATVCGVPNILVFRHEWRSSGRRWHTGWISHEDGDVTDIRPLIVLDPADAPQDVPGTIVDHLRELANEGIGPCHLAGWLADQWEAQTEPERIPEPGLWAVVKARTPDSGSLRLQLVRVDEKYPLRWQPVCMNYSQPYTWDDLIDPELVREGV